MIAERTDSSLRLSQAERDSYARDGYLVREGAFDPEEVDRMRHEADAILSLLINSSVATSRTSGRIDADRRSDGTVHVRKVQPVNDLSLYFSQLVTDERLIGPLRELMGCDPVLMEEKLNYKQPIPNWPVELHARDRNDYFAPHNDWAFYRAQRYPQDIVSSMIVMDDCTPENGPLVLWRGSHHEYLEHAQSERGDLTVLPGLIDESAGEDLLAPAGSIVFFHALLVHSSRPNDSGAPRRLMIYSHYPSREDHGIDVRNGPTRLREAPWEHDYLRRRVSGEIDDTFALPPSR